MLDIIIRGGDVVTPQSVVRGDVAIAGETIAAVTAPGALARQSGMREIDASGRIVMPGESTPMSTCTTCGSNPMARRS